MDQEERVTEAIEHAFRTAGHELRRRSDNGTVVVEVAADDEVRGQSIDIIYDDRGVQVRRPDGSTLPQVGPIPWSDERLPDRLWDCLTPYFHALPRFEIKA